MAESFERLIQEIYKQVNAPHGDDGDDKPEQLPRPAKGMVLKPTTDEDEKKKAQEDDCKC